MKPLTLQALAFLILANASAQPSMATEGEVLSDILSGVPDTRQSTEYSCGAAALQAVLGYWGRDVG